MERCDSDGRAQQGRETGGQHDESDRVLHSIDRRVKVDEAYQSVSADQRFESVADTDTGGDEQGSSRQNVRDDGADEDARPQREASEHERCQCDSSGRPDQRCKTGNRLDAEADSRRHDVQHRDYGNRTRDLQF
jgi:hypothetical protein